MPHVDFATPLEITYRVAFDVSRGSSSATAVEVALSAMTAFAVLQERGFHVNPF